MYLSGIIYCNKAYLITPTSLSAKQFVGGTKIYYYSLFVDNEYSQSWVKIKCILFTRVLFVLVEEINI